MMGNRGVKGGGELDCLTRARRYHRFRAGTVRRFKRKFWKRQRREARSDHGQDE